MLGFTEWIRESTAGNDQVFSQIDALYDKAKYAIKLVQVYSKATNQSLLNNISTIAPLNSSVYGLYNSGENRRIIGPAAASKVKFKFGQDALQNQDLQKIPQYVIKQHIPDIDERQIAPSNVIRVNVRKIVSEMGDTPDTVIEIASTIIHEATHEMEFQASGKTDENGPKRAEDAFRKWVRDNWRTVVSRIPQLNF
jgi:hypothetical protein